MTTKYNAYIGWFGQVRMWIGTAYIFLFALGLLGFVNNDLARIRVNPAAHGWWIRVNLESLVQQADQGTEE